MATPIFSIIIPAYNADKVLNKAIESVLNQNFELFELIIIDDGSQDNTKNIAYKYAAEDSRIHVLVQSNCGASSARNKGIEYAKGQYIMFLDSDDRYKANYLSTIYGDLLQNTELTIVGFDIYKNGNKYNKICYISNGEDHGEEKITIVQYLEFMLQYHDQAYWGANWNKVYCAEIIKRNKILFQDGVSIGEDLYFNLCYLKYVKNINVIYDSLYEYEVATVDSLSKQKRTGLDYCKQYVQISNRYIQLCFPYSSEIKNYNKLMDRFINLAIWDSAWTEFINHPFKPSFMHSINEHIRNEFNGLYSHKVFITSLNIYNLLLWSIDHKMDNLSWMIFLLVFVKRSFMKKIRRMLKYG